MADNLESEQKKEIDLDLTGLSVTEKAQVKIEVGNLLLNEIKRHLSRGKTPVANQKEFEILNKEYAAQKKQGSRTPTLQLSGSLLSSIKSVPTQKDSIKIGVFDSNQYGKAEGHNRFEGKAPPNNMPIRRFIPGFDQTFKNSIEQKVKRLIDRKKAQTPNVLIQKSQATAKPTRSLSETVTERLGSLSAQERNQSISLLVDDILRNR